MGFQWPFRHLIARGVPKGGSLNSTMTSIMPQILCLKTANLVAQKIAVPRARDSVRRASDFVQIAISLRTKVKEATAC
jgi:hypothetical protein